MMAMPGCQQDEFELEPEIEPVIEAEVLQETLKTATSSASSKGVLPSGAKYCIIIPDGWNGELLVYAHGYVDPDDPVELPDDELADGTKISALITQLGFGYASTSYRANGLVVKDAISDLEDLMNVIKASPVQPNHVYLGGVSEGALIAALTIEKNPDLFDGAIGTCGPIGNFRKQINYFGDFHVVFNYFFPGVIPGDPSHIPDDVFNNWYNIYAGKVQQAIINNPYAAQQVLKVTGAKIDPSDPATVVNTFLVILRYNIMATNNAIEVLGGQPFQNKLKFYHGSDNDYALNRGVARFKVSQEALDEMRLYYHPKGDLKVPFVTIHTIGDPLTPYWHERFYKFKVLRNGNYFYHRGIPVARYGHCNFTRDEILTAISLMIKKVTLLELMIPQSVFPDMASLDKFIEMAKENGINPKVVEELPVR